MKNYQKPEIGLLRFTTAGSVDDGKSTLIGRLLYDCKSIFEDQLEQIAETSKKRGNDEIDLSLLTDGLRAEREQGITIDVAYRYFSTPKRKFIIADTPGHIQYTRNMVTGASTADVAVILSDAKKGVLEQTIRHTYIASLLNMKHIIFCVNKMDLTTFSKDKFNSVKAELEAIADGLDVKSTFIIPISAKFGDNVVEKSSNMPWYNGPTLLELLETVRIADDYQNTCARFPVQYIIRTDPSLSEFYRAYAGRVAGGKFRKDQKIKILPAMLDSKITKIDASGKELEEAKSGESVTIYIKDDIDISRGNMIVPADDVPVVTKDFTAMICWFNERELNTGTKYLLRQFGNETKCIIKNVNYKVDINKIKKDYENKTVKMNDIVELNIKTANSVFIDKYFENPVSGSFIIIDENTNETVAAGMIINN